ncbi:hypothetical protein BDZ89DRAFT_1011226 [Hymenopellis radicata]|nr:hypothetical protein BDZ89DRAFT_1011226 [Hymenopellis radicata]
MLSAVAARKAAQAAKQAPLTPDTSVPKVTDKQAESPASRPPPSSSKRKPSSQSAPAAKRKKKKSQEKGKIARYFQDSTTDSIHVDQDIITIESDDSDVEQDADSLDDIDFSIAEFQPKVASSTVPPTQRAWSPSVPVADSSDEEDDDVDEEMAPPPIAEETDALSTFQPIRDQNVFTLDSADMVSLGYADDGLSATLVVLQPGDTLSFVGAYKFSVVQGSIMVLGTTFHPAVTTHNVFAPRSSPIPVIKAAASTSTPLSLPVRLKAHAQPSETVIVLHELRTNVQGLERICATFEGVFRPLRRHATNFDFGVPGLSMVSESIKNVHPFRLPPSWAAVLFALPEHQEIADTYLIQGSKKSGKSTFARTLTNQLLSKYQRVAFLECDLGQSEFTPGGMVALNIVESPLLGPPFTHPSLPVSAHYIGATSPKSSPSHYLAAIQACVQTYRLDIKTPIDNGTGIEDNRISDSIPLVINTMGWTKGLGADLLIKIHEIAQPGQIFEIEAPVFDDWMQPTPAPSREHIHLLKPIPQPQNTVYSATDIRTLSLLSYFHAIFPTAPQADTYRQLTATSWNTSLPLCAQAPYEVQTSTAIDQVVLTGAGAEDVVAAQVATALNVAIVGLVSCEPGALDVMTPLTGTSIPYAQGVSAPSPMSSTCQGLALIRSLSPQGDVLHLLTPTPSALLGDARVLVKGEMELPVWGMLDFRSKPEEGVAGVDMSKVPFLQWEKARGIGAEKRKVRRNLMRRGQM